MVKRILAAATSVLLLSVPVVALTKEPVKGAATSAQEVSASTASDLEMLLAEFATTPEQHRALARYFKAKANEHRALADKHGAMAQTYSSGKLRDAQLMREHCQKIAKSEADIASEYDQMAKVHEAEAGR